MMSAAKQELCIASKRELFILLAFAAFVLALPMDHQHIRNKRQRLVYSIFMQITHNHNCFPSHLVCSWQLMVVVSQRLQNFGFSLRLELVSTCLGESIYHLSMLTAFPHSTKPFQFAGPVHRHTLLLPYQGGTTQNNHSINVNEDGCYNFSTRRCHCHCHCSHTGDSQNLDKTETEGNEHFQISNKQSTN